MNASPTPAVSRAQAALPRALATLRRRASTVAALAAIVGLGCSGVAAALGPSPLAARRAGDELLHSMAARFTNVLRDAKVTHARSVLAKHALVPSRVHRDTSIWTSADGEVRTLAYAGRFSGEHYVFGARSDAPAPDTLAESRHVVSLHHLGGDDWQWETHVEHAVGRLRAADLPVFGAAMLSAAEGREPRTLRIGYRLAFPRTTAALGRVYSLDTLRTIRDRDGATTLAIVARAHPERLRRTYPHLARYVERYNLPSRLRVVLADAGGAPWLEASSEKGLLRLRLRVHEGRLLPLEGPARPMPDSLQLHGSAHTRVMLFDVGFEGLVGDVVLRRAEHERTFAMRFDREPEWQLPPVMGQLVGAPLRRPFAEGGATLVVGLRDGAAGGQSLLVRDSRLVVRESAIVRWLGTLGGTAMGDFAGETEREQNRFVAELFGALQADLRALPLGDGGSARKRGATGGSRKAKRPTAVVAVGASFTSSSFETWQSATRAVIGTLRPTERRRACADLARSVPDSNWC